MKRPFVRLAALVGLCLFTGPPATPAQHGDIDLTGTYYGKNSGLTATIKKHGECYQVHWKSKDNASWVGMGYVKEKTFITAWDHPNGGNLGLGEYKIEPGAKGPKLVGWCVQYQMGALNKHLEKDEIEFVGK